MDSPGLLEHPLSEGASPLLLVPSRDHPVERGFPAFLPLRPQLRAFEAEASLAGAAAYFRLVRSTRDASRWFDGRVRL
jgi:hypothetical protein